MNFSYKGKILISTPDISGDIFSRSVVLIIDHNEEGAFGLILNKKNKLLSEEARKLNTFSNDIFEGGPVENNKTFLIVKGQPVTNHFIDINGEYYVTEDVESVAKSIFEGTIETENLKVFSGYSGWSAQQLESEISRKMWTVVDVYNLDYTFAQRSQFMEKHHAKFGGEFLLWANAPEDVSLN